MTPLRSALAPSRHVANSRSLLKGALVGAIAVLSPLPSLKADPAAEALSFKVTARVGYSVPGESPLPPQTIQAKVLIRGPQARVETTLGGQPRVILYSPPYLYQLLPTSKAGVRWKAPARPARDNGMDYQALLRDPGQIRAAVQRAGAHKLASLKLAGIPVDTYEVDNFRGEKGQKLTVWLRATDALPLRLIIKGSNTLVAASWSEYSRPRNVSSAQFAPPAGYKIRDSQSQAPFPQI